jgi:hypothetical protein
MVILETAAITAAGYGLYRGGDAAVRKGKETHKELVLERVRQSQRSELKIKSKTRQNRVSELLQLRQGVGGGATSSSSGRSTDGTVGILLEESVSSSTVEDRHKNVMEKLRSSRTQEVGKPGAKLIGLFGKKK